MKTNKKITDIFTAVEIFYSKPELENADIKKLFGCSHTTAVKLKTLAKEQQIADGNRTFSETAVHTNSAYKAWMLDIADLERRATKLRKFQQKGQESEK